MRARPIELGSVKALDGRVERCLASLEGYLLIFGWAADYESPDLVATFVRDMQIVRPKAVARLRYARPDVEAALGGPPHDFGFLILARVEPAQALPDGLVIGEKHQERHSDVQFEKVSLKTCVEETLALLGSFPSHAGREAALHQLLSNGGLELIHDATALLKNRASSIQYAERFGPRRDGVSFVTVLFGSVDATMYQPLLFAKAGVQFGDWTYVCNSPELGEQLIRRATTAARLYDLPLRVLVLSGNAGFGGGNNIAIEQSEGAHIALLNPDIHVMPQWSGKLNEAMSAERFGHTLRGGLLYYDEETLMHGGMYLEEDIFFGREMATGANSSCSLLRVEHYDKGVPFIAQDWTRPRPVPAVTGAFMAFSKACFEQVGGFSSDFIFGHYEDADLSLRWRPSIGAVEVDPDIRLIHLEGLGSRTRLPHFHGAAVVNRFAFDFRNRRFAASARKQTTQDLV